MLAGLSKEHKDRLHLKDASHYKYLTGVRKDRLHLKDASHYKYLTGVRKDRLHLKDASHYKYLTGVTYSCFLISFFEVTNIFFTPKV